MDGAWVAARPGPDGDQRAAIRTISYDGARAERKARQDSGFGNLDKGSDSLAIQWSMGPTAIFVLE